MGNRLKSWQIAKIMSDMMNPLMRMKKSHRSSGAIAISRSKYNPHQGEKEMARRRHQIEKEYQIHRAVRLRWNDRL